MLHVAMTGHRPNKLLGGYDLDSVENKKLLKYLIELLNELLEEHGNLHTYSGMALGVDTIWSRANAIVKAQGGNIFIENCIPCTEHYSRWKESDVERWHKLNELADKVTFVSEEPYTPWCMQIRNEYMVDNCDLLLAVWDGTKGGTYNCVKYAEKKGKETKQITVGI